LFDWRETVTNKITENEIELFTIELLEKSVIPEIETTCKKYLQVQKIA